MDNKKLYIPVPIRRRKEVANGIGREEIVKISILVVIGLAIGGIAFAATNQIYILVLLPCLFLVFGFIFLQKDITNKNVIDRLKEMMEFQRNQKRYMYRYQNIYEEEVYETSRKKENESKGTDCKRADECKGY